MRTPRTSLALASLRSRRASYTAAFLSVLLGATVVGAFATLLETGLSTTGDDAETLVTMGSVVGGWGVVIVLFSVASTLTLTVRQRVTEIALLRTVGATPWQARRMVMAETLVVALAAGAAAVVPAMALGRVVFELTQGADMVSATLDPRPGVVAVTIAGAVMTVVAVLAAALASRRGSRIAATAALRESSVAAARMPRWRIVLGLLFVAGGLNLAILTVTVMADSSDPYAPMSTAGEASVTTSIGLAILAPVLLRWAAAAGRPVLLLFGAPGRLAAYDADRRSHLLAGILMPVVVFVGMGTGTAYLMAVENVVAERRAATVEDQAIETLNAVVVAMISVFAAIMVVNTIAAVVSGRRRELARQRLVGATPEQVMATMLLETGLVAVAGIVLGGLAALTTVLPYSWVKLDRVTPGLGPWYFVAAAVIALAITLASTYVTTRRATALRAVEAAAVTS